MSEAATPLPSRAASIPWEERPPGSDGTMWRSSRNPIIARDQLPRSNSIFNSAVVPFGNGFAGVFRIDDTSRTMNIHAGRSADGIDWEIDEQPIAFTADRFAGWPRSRDVRARLRPARDLARGSLLRDVVQRLPRPDDRHRLHARLRHVPPARQRVPALQPQRRAVPAEDQRQVRSCSAARATTATRRSATSSARRAPT